MILLYKAQYLSKMDHLKMLGQKDELIRMVYEYLHEITEDQFSYSDTHQMKQKQRFINYCMDFAEKIIYAQYLRKRIKNIHLNNKWFIRNNTKTFYQKEEFLEGRIAQQMRYFTLRANT